MASGNRINIAGKVNTFKNSKKEIDDFIDKVWGYKRITNKQKYWCYEYAIIRLYCAFEQLMLDALKGAMNKDPKAFTDRTGVRVHGLHVNLAEYIIAGDGYFDFKGYSGLVQTLKKYLPAEHWLVVTVSNEDYRASLEQLSAFRNYAAHSGNNAKHIARKVVSQGSITSAGEWLSKHRNGKTRYAKIADDLIKLSERIRSTGSDGS